MTIGRWNWRRLHVRLLSALAGPALLALGGTASAAEPLAPPIVGCEVRPTGLAEWRRMAVEKQPALSAYRASAAAAEEKLNALENLCLAGLLRRDLATRRLQAEQGIVAAHAQLDKAEWDTLYSVTRTYLSVIYARQQLAIADEALDKRPTAVKSLYFLRDLAEKVRKDKARRDVKQYNVDAIDSLIELTVGRRQEALQGVERAKAALREAVGLEYDCPLVVDGLTELPDLTATIDRDTVVRLAQERRGEMKQAAAGLEVTSLEVTAQKKSFMPRAQTFAAGSDLHAEPVPQGFANGEYRPGAITVEMPGQLFGRRHDRIDQAEALQGRAASVLDKTRHLITLEAEDAYYRWVETSTQVAQYRKAAEKAAAAADQLADPDKGGFNPGDKEGGRPTFDELVEARVRAVQYRLLANQARFNALLALAALERVTAGGINPGFHLLGLKKP